jgi:pyridoxamine 5'-phosphate oxidase
MPNRDIAGNRREYRGKPLIESEVPADPFVLFRSWFEDAVEMGLRDPTAFHLSTATREGIPSGRIVLMKDFSEAGFVFFTNTESRKGAEMRENPRVAMTFYWSELDRQVRIEGSAAPIPDSESDAYFTTRPRGSQLATWVSKQSGILESRQRLEEDMASVIERIGPDQVPRPLNFRGYRVVPSAIEFWQGQPSRLHDRLLYQESTQGWSLVRLYP